jgi:hypothetical protein
MEDYNNSLSRKIPEHKSYQHLARWKTWTRTQQYNSIIISQDNRPQVDSTSRKMEDLNQVSIEHVISQDNRLQVNSTSRKMDDLNNDLSYIKSNDKKI